MGASFLLIPAGAGVPLVVLCLIGFTFGEMLWGPASQSLIADLAPQGLRGTAMGVLGSTTTAGVALAGGAGLAIYETAGDAAMWLSVAACAIVSAGLYAIASHGRPAPHAAGSLEPASNPPPRESEGSSAEGDEDGDGWVLVEASTKESE